MTTLEDLYYGNISPHERYIKQGTRVDKLVKLICNILHIAESGLFRKPLDMVQDNGGIVIVAFLGKTAKETGFQYLHQISISKLHFLGSLQQSSKSHRFHLSNPVLNLRIQNVIPLQDFDCCFVYLHSLIIGSFSVFFGVFQLEE